MALDSDFRAFHLVIDYYSHQKRSFSGRLQQMSTNFEILSQPEMSRLLAVANPFINIRRLRRDYQQVAHKMFPRLYIYGIYRYLDHNNKNRFSLSYNYNPNPFSQPQHVDTNNPYITLMYLAHKENLSKEKIVFKPTDILRNIKRADYLQPVIFLKPYWQKVSYGARYQGMYSEHHLYKGYISIGQGYIGKKITLNQKNKLYWQGIQLLCENYICEQYNSMEEEHQNHFNKYYNLLQHHKLVPFHKIITLPRIPAFKLINGIIYQIKQSKVVNGRS